MASLQQFSVEAHLSPILLSVLAVVISDLHLGTRTGTDLLSRPDVRSRLIGRLQGADEVVLLGDSIELRDRPLAEALTIATPFFEDLGEALAGRRVTLVPGNHDHQLASAWLQRRRSEPLGLEQRVRPEPDDPLGRLARRMGDTRLELAYPGIWLRPDVYATHGHYLDCHNGIRTFECFARAVSERLVRRGGYSAPDDYEAVLAPIYRLFYRAAQWSWAWNGAALGKAAIRRAEGAENRQARVEPGLRAMARVVETLGIAADHVLFGHLHHPAEWSTQSGTRLVNTGTWRDTDAVAACVLVRNEGSPELSYPLGG
jgi:UDP-2,3-diacylglucosamine pyrophosphatase LpxH